MAGHVAGVEHPRMFPIQKFLQLCSRIEKQQVEAHELGRAASPSAIVPPVFCAIRLNTVLATKEECL